MRDYKKIIDVIENAGLKSYLFDLCEYNGGNAQEGKTECSWSSRKKLEPGQLQWPTLGEMRKQKKRLIIFSDKEADSGYGIMHTKNYMETDYDLKKSPNCEMRGDNRATTASLFVMNHFYKLPHGLFIEDAAQTNDYNKLHERICSCFFQKGLWPNFIAVDYVNVGETKKIVSDINKNNIKCHNDYIISVFDNYCRKCTANIQLEFRKSKN